MPMTLLADALLPHAGHELTVATYIGAAGETVNVSLECLDCCEVVFDTDAYGLVGLDDGGVTLSGKQVAGFKGSIDEMHAIYLDENRIDWYDADDMAKDIAYELGDIIGWGRGEEPE